MTTEVEEDPRLAEAAALLLAGQPVKTVATELNIRWGTVRDIRRNLGLRPKNRLVPVDEKYDMYAGPEEPGGHRFWTGRRGPSGTPVVRVAGKVVPAAAVAFERRTGRRPLGMCRAECGEQHCIAPAHVADERERRTVRQQERALYGLDAQPWDVCPAGKHGWDEHGRIAPAPSLDAYCAGCNTERARALRARKKAM